nr:hypothetical protein [Tanacetum cinerariifolium]
MTLKRIKEAKAIKRAKVKGEPEPVNTILDLINAEKTMTEPRGSNPMNKLLQTLNQFPLLFQTTSSEFSPTPPRDESKRKCIAIEEEPLKPLLPLLDQTEYEAKKKRMLEEYNYYVTFRADPMPITKISYKVDSSKQASIRIIKGNNLLNLTVYDKFGLKMLSFTKWLELHALASKSNTKVNNLLFKILKAKFTSLKSQAEKLGLTPPPQLSTFDLHAPKKKRKGSPEAEDMFAKMKLIIEARNDVTEARKVVKDNLDGLGQHV